MKSLLVDKVVKERQAEKAFKTKKVKTKDNGERTQKNKEATSQQEMWKRLAKEPFYVVELTVRNCSQSIRLNGIDLGLPPGVLERLEAIATRGYSARVETLNKAGNSLKKNLNQVYKHCLFSQPWHLCHEDQKINCLKAIEALKAEAQHARQALLNSYKEDLTSWLEAIEGILIEAGISELQREAALKRYADAYPTYQTLKNEALHVAVVRFEPVPRMVDTIRQDTEAARAMAEKAKAEAEKLEAELMLQGQQALLESLLSTLGAAQYRSRDEGFGIFAELLDRMGGREPGKVTDKAKGAWDDLFARLEVLVKADKNLVPLISRAQLLRDIFLNEKPIAGDDLQTLLDDFQTELKRALATGNGEGSSRLDKVLSLESNYKDLLTQLKNLEANPDPAKWLELKSQISSLEQVYKHRNIAIKKAKVAAENAMKRSLGISESPNSKHFTMDEPSETERLNEDDEPDEGAPTLATQSSSVYDSEAGF